MAVYKNVKAAPEPEPIVPVLALPGVGSTLTVLAGVAFLFVCMILPLVGKAGVQTMHAHKNYVAFLCALLATLGLSGLASISKLERRKIDQSPRPLFSLALCVLCALLLVALFLGLLRI